jgi:cyclohexanone monooxygenase
MAPSQEPIGSVAPPFDPEALAAKYREERSKRLRPDGVHQYREAKGELAGFAKDPWINDIPRDPIDEEVDVLIIGGGFGGLLAAVKLVEAGVKDIRIVEKSADFGGVWYWNRYPGVQCDIER